MIRCVTYNVSGGLDVAAAAAVLAGLEADVVGIIEAPGRRGVRRLAEAAGLEVAARAGGRKFPVALLVSERARVLSHRSHDLDAGAEVKDRPALHAIVGVAGLRLSVVVAQLGMRPEARIVNAQQIEGILAKVDAEPLVLADLNEAPGGDVVRRLCEVLQDSFTVAGEGRGESYPTPDPSVRQDYAMVGRGLAVTGSWVPSQPPVDVASHHRPVVADVAAVDHAADPSAGSAA